MTSDPTSAAFVRDAARDERNDAALRGNTHMHLFALTVVLAAGPLDLTWGTGPQGLQKLVATPDDLLLKQVLACAKGYGVKTIERRGAKAEPVWSAADASTDALTGVSKAERVALLSMMGRQARGAEFDLLIPQGDGTFVPVSLWWDTPEVVGFASGAAWKPQAPGDVTPAQLQARFKVGEFLEADSKWDAAALTALEQALASLTADELKLVAGLKFRRARVSGKHLALYQRGDQANHIEVYDTAFSLDGEQFVGEPAAPRAFLQTALLHELGHALADARLRERGIANLALRQKWEALKAEGKSAEATQAAFDAANGAVKQLLALDAANAKPGRLAERELAKVFPQNRSPTQYGRTKAAEHFAESFSLWKNDRAALARISPEAAAWFDAGKHVAIAGAPLD